MLNHFQLLDILLSILTTLNQSNFGDTANCIPQPYIGSEGEISKQYDLPSVLVPPEVIELDSMSAEAGEESQIKRDDWPEFFVRLFPDDVSLYMHLFVLLAYFIWKVSPNPKSPAGYIVRTALMDMIEIFEVNRKESARLLLEYPKWSLPGTFKPKPGATTTTDPEPGKDWQLESTIIEVRHLLVPDLQLFTDVARADCSWCTFGSSGVFEKVNILYRTHH